MAAKNAAGALAALATDASECDRAVGGPSAAPGVCSTAAMVENVASFLQAPPASDPQAVLQAAAARLACGSEACVVTHPQVVGHVASLKGAKAAERHKRQARLQLKTPGPRYGNALLNNHDIDEVLSRWAAEFDDFFNCPFAMSDFDAVGGYRLTRVSLEAVRAGREQQTVFGRGAVKRPCTTFGCVLNTDVSSGRGKHWVCLFADLRGAQPTVEYFNSSGRPPQRAAAVWMERQAADLGGASRVVSDVSHQRSETECGLYSLYYIRARLEGRPAAAFREKRITDAEMEEFRQHVFSASHDRS